MTKYFERACTRIGKNSNSVMSWSKGEEPLGLKNSFFICENGTVTQYVDCEEAEKFHEYIKNLSEEEFNKICNEFFEAIENEDLSKMHEALAVFDEMDNYNLGTEDMKKRLLRVRKSTESASYEIVEESEVKNFIIYKGEIYKK